LRRIVHAAPPRCLRPLPRALNSASKRLPNNLIKLNKHVWRALSTCGHPRLGFTRKPMGNKRSLVELPRRRAAEMIHR
jgi:hypothetical protein